MSYNSIGENLYGRKSLMDQPTAEYLAAFGSAGKQSVNYTDSAKYAANSTFYFDSSADYTNTNGATIYIASNNMATA